MTPREIIAQAYVEAGPRTPGWMADYILAAKIAREFSLEDGE